jgi:hypothetical protein
MSARRSSFRWQTALVFALLLAVIVATGLFTPQKPTLPPLSSRSTEKDGSRALFDGLAGLGFQVSNRPGSQYAIPAGTQAVFLLEPALWAAFEQGDWDVLDRFVEDGGTLVAAQETLDTIAIHYGFTPGETGYSDYLNAFTPVLHSPPFDSAQIKLSSNRYLQRDTLDYQPLLTQNGRPYAVSFARGKGQVVLVADTLLFRNAGLKQAGAVQLLLNLLAPLPRGARVWFDEWHHGERDDPAAVEDLYAGPGDWLLYTPGGQAVLWVLLVTFASLVLSGRYFGRPLSAEKDTIRRAPIEYVNALAGLNQRAGQRSAVLQEYYHQLKRSLGQRYRLDPALPDAGLAHTLAEMRAEIDAEALLSLLRRLQAPHPSEQEMVDLAHEATLYIRSKIDNQQSKIENRKSKIL